CAAEREVTRGSFRASQSDPHLAPRQRLLGNATPLHSPTAATLAGPAADAGGLHQEITEQLWRQGLAVVQLDHPLSPGRFMSIGYHLGTAIPETDPVVQPYVQDGVILNLRSRHAPTAAV